MTKRNFWTLLLLALIFATPGITAYVYFQHPAWLLQATTNKGELLNPPVQFAGFENSKKWHFVLWYPKNCDKACLNLADKLARVRLALGRRLYEVEQWVVVDGDSQSHLSELSTNLSQQDIHVFPFKNNAYPVFGSIPNVFIASPNGYLVLRYAADANPRDIFHDMKQLLNTNEKSG
ncbi:MAG: hypothetical protein WC785_02575 [Tatlockia sp.]|jgi:hypothetical protein